MRTATFGQLVPVHDAWVDSRIPGIASTLTRLDPTLVLSGRLDNLTNHILRYEVHRHNLLLAYWLPHEVHMIITDILKMTAAIQRPSTVPSAMDRITKHNDSITRDARRQARDALLEAREYLATLWHDRNNPRNVFHQIPGLKKESE